jgi:hypothetical protein
MSASNTSALVPSRLRAISTIRAERSIPATLQPRSASASSIRPTPHQGLSTLVASNRATSQSASSEMSQSNAMS